MRFLLLVLCLSANAATVYYVDPGAGSDSNNGTSTATAWAHIPGKAGGSGGPTTVINNGDSIIVKGGSSNLYSVAIVASNYNGSAAFDSILIQSGDRFSPAWGTGAAIIDGQGTRTYGVGFDNVKGITLDGFEIRNIAAGSSAWGGNGSAGVELGANSTIGFQYVSIKRCYIHNLTRSAGDQGHGMEADHGDHLLVYYNQVGPSVGTKGIEPNGVNLGVISNNFVTGTGDHCISLTRTTNFDVCNNLLAQAGAQVHEPTYCISVSLAMNCDVWNNLMFDTASSLTNAFEASGGIGVYANPPSLTIGDRFFHNTLYGLFQKNNGSVSTAVRIGDDGTTQIVTNIVLMNNLVFGCTNIIGPEQFFLRPIGTTNDTLSYNDFYGTAPGQTVMSYGNSPYTYQTVAAYSPGAGLTYNNNQQLDPAVLTAGGLPNGLDTAYHPNTTFFALSQACPTAVKSTGNSLTGSATFGYDHSAGKFQKDIVGNTRSFWSMGAYEFVSFPPVLTNVTMIMK